MNDILENYKKNCITHWFDAVKNSGVLYPETKIIETDAKLVMIPYGEYESLNKEDKDKIADFFSNIEESLKQILTYPKAFIRSGQTSAKHNWKNTCYIDLLECNSLEKRIKYISDHILSIVEFSEMAGIVGLPTNIWVIREFLELNTVFEAFYGKMPINREYRFFADNKFVYHVQPYWPKKAFKDEFKDKDKVQVNESKFPNWEKQLQEINTISKEEYEFLKEEVIKITSQLDGSWSVDMSQHKDGRWFCTDMAIASMSFHYKPEIDNVGNKLIFRTR